MLTSKNTTLQIANDCDSLRIVVFWKILKTNNIFLIDNDYYKGKQYKKDEHETIINTWNAIYDEAFKLRSSSTAKSILQEKSKQSIFKTKLDLILATNSHLNTLVDCKDDLSEYTFNKMLLSIYECYKKIDSKIKVNKSKTVNENIDSINRFYKAIKNTYNFAVKKSNKKIDKEVKNMYSLVAQVEQVLGRSFSDIEQMTVSRWIAQEEIAKKIIKERKNTKTNGRK